DSAKAFDALDGDEGRAKAGDTGAHAVQHVPEPDDLWLSRRVHDERRAGSACRGHHQGFRAGVARIVHVDTRALERADGGVDAVLVALDMGPHALEAAQVHVDRALADLVTAWHGKRDLA